MLGPADTSLQRREHKAHSRLVRWNLRKLASNAGTGTPKRVLLYYSSHKLSNLQNSKDLIAVHQR